MPDGRLIAVGELYQTLRGGRVTERLVFHFKDGSLDDETTVFTQRGKFALVSDHHVQRGPFFPHPMETSIDVRSGTVTVRSMGKDGKEDVDTQHMDLPADLANGLTFVVGENLLPQTTETDLSMIVATPKVRLVKLAFTPRGEEPFSVAGWERKAERYDIKIDLGGVAGVVAPLIGKQPPDFEMWILGGEAPTVVKETGFLYAGGPVLTFELASPVWPVGPDGSIVK